MIVWGSLVLLGGVLLGQVDAPHDDDLKLEVRRLVRRLDAREFAERETAEQALIELGPDVLDLLPTMTDRASAEVRQRVARIRQKLQRALAASATQASQVTLHGDAMPLSKILSAIQEQTGNKIVDLRDRFGPEVDDPKLKVNFDNGPFWETVDQVLDQAGLSLYSFGDEKALNVTARAESQLPRAARASYSGPFRFEAIRVEARRDLRNPAGQSLALWLEIAWEPRLAPISLGLQMADVEAFDENGNPLTLAAPDAELEVPVDPESMATELRIPLKLPPRSVTKIARLKGTLRALVPGKIETFQFEDLAKAANVEKRVAGVTVTLEQVRKNRDVWEVRTRIHFDETSGALASHRNWIYDNEACLVDPNGEEIPYHAYDTTRQTENEVGIAYLFGVDGPLDGYGFVYKTATMILSTGFDFEIRDVTLP